MSDTEILSIRVQVQRALTALSRPRNERDQTEVVAALTEISQALAKLSPA